jgi:hypothetical protein
MTAWVRLHITWDFASSRMRLGVFQSLDSMSALHFQWCFHLVSLIYIYCQSTLFPHLDVDTPWPSPYWLKPWQYVHISTPLHLYLFFIVLLGPFNRQVAAVVGDFVCLMPNQTRIFLPLMQNSEVKLRVDKRYGPDDTTLWPQLWVEMWAPFPESLTIPMIIFQSCGRTQPLMTFNFSAAVSLMD